MKLRVLFSHSVESAISGVSFWNGDPFRITEQKHIWFDFFVGFYISYSYDFSTHLVLIT